LTFIAQLRPGRVQQLPLAQLAAGAVQHEVGHRGISRLLRRSARSGGLIAAVGRVLQRTSASKPLSRPLAQFEHRLVGHRQLAVVDGAAQVAFQAQAVGHLGVQAGVEQA
jgi:hypothetical protein